MTTLNNFTHIDGDAFESLADFSFGDPYSPNYKPLEISSILKDEIDSKNEAILFVDTERLLQLIKLVNIFKNKITIIAHNSDYTIDYNFSDIIPNNVKVWCQNYNNIETDRLFSLPIGMERTRWFPELKKRNFLEFYRKKSISNKNNDISMYFNCNCRTNPIRLQMLNFLSNFNYAPCTIKTIGNGSSFDEYLKDITDVTHVLSPPGNGIDCHRTWETLYLNRIPILMRSHFVQNIYHDLPVIIIDKFDDLNYIHNDDSIDKHYNLEKLNFEYWKNKILNKHYER
jgi:hypothetical protein